MRKVFIVGILVILLASSVQASSGVLPAFNPSIDSQHYLNFNSYSLGSYPSNLSWANFSNVSKNIDTRISIENSIYGRGLTISTFAYRNLSDSYLRIGLGLFPEFTLKMTFTWNENNSLSQTGQELLFQDSTGNLLDYKFGSNYNNSLYLGSNDTQSLGPEPQPSGLYTLQLSGSELNSNIYAGIASGFNQTSHMPVVFKNSYSSTAGNYSLLIGGGFSNLTIYSIYLCSNVSGFDPLISGSNINYRESNISSVYFPGINPGLFAKPLVDWKDNSIIYTLMNTGGEVYSYNFYNNSNSTLFRLGSSQFLISTAGTDWNGYFLIGNATGSVIYIYNYTTGSTSKYRLNIDPGQESRIYPAESQVFIQSENGSVYDYNTGMKELVANLSFKTGTYTVQSWATGASFETEIFNNSTGLLSAEELNSNGTFKNIFKVNLSEVDLSPSFTHGDLSSLGSSYCLFPNHTLETFYGLSGEVFTPYIIGSNFSIADWSHNYTFLQNKSGIYLLENGYINLTSVNADSQFLAFNPNLTEGLSINNATITLYSINNETYSHDNISIDISVPDVIRGNISLGYSVHSKVSYTVSATLGNTSLPHSNNTVDINTIMFGNGTYTFSITASNIAGYFATFTKSVSIDNYLPVVASDPANGSLLLSGSQIGFEISNITGIIHITVQEPGNFTLDYSGYNFNVSTPSESGFFNITVELVDRFGLSYNFTFSYMIDAPNLSGYSTNIAPGSYLRSGNLNLSWMQVSFASTYNVTLTSGDLKSNIVTRENFTRLDLSSGQYALYLNATTSSGNTKELLEETFYVQDFNPSLAVNRTAGNYFSFFGDSPNNSLCIEASTNVTSRLWVNTTGPQGSETLYNGNGTYLNFTISRSSAISRIDGLYNFSVVAMERSGRVSSRNFTISINNSIPHLLTINTTLYYNTSNAELPIVFESNTSYWYSAVGANQSNISLSQPFLRIQNLSTEIILNARDLWGNYNETPLRIIYSERNPSILLNATPLRLLWSRNLTITYRIADPVQLSTVELLVNNVTVHLGNASSGMVNYKVNQDGTFNLTIEAMDLCGNSNISMKMAVKSFYYPHITAFVPEVSILMGFAHFNSGLTGKDLETVNITWSENGKEIGSGSSFWALVMPGSHMYVLTLHYHSTTIYREKRIFTLGFAPELAASLAIIGAFLYRKYSGSTDVSLSREIVLENLGMKRKEIYRTARKAGVRIGTLTDTIAAMQKADEVLLLRDPDGVVYLMDPKAANE